MGENSRDPGPVSVVIERTLYRLEQRLDAIFSAQTLLVQRHSQADERWLELVRKMDQVIAILGHHSQLLENLPAAVKEKIGFTEAGS